MINKVVKSAACTDDVPLYSSRVAKNYIEYLKKFYPQIDVIPLLEYAGLTTYQVEDGGHWYSQRQADLLQEIIVKKTQNANIAREVGRHFCIAKASGVLSSYAFGFLTPSAAYGMIDHLAGLMSRATTMSVRKKGENCVEVVVTPHPGINERPYQCENRLGSLESVALLFTNKLASIDHVKCIHRNDPFCQYIITWQQSNAASWKRVRNHFSIIGLFIAAAFCVLLPAEYDIIPFLTYTAVVLGLSFHSEKLAQSELSLTIKSQGDLARKLLDEINIRYNESQLVNEIGQATSMILEIEELLSKIMEVLNNRLDFDRGMVLLANKEKTRLVYMAGYGYDSEYKKYLEEVEFHLDNPESRGPAVLAFREQKPFLIEDVRKIERDISARSLEFAQRMGAESFICVPLLFEGESLGVLMVDNIRSKKTLEQSDLNLLMGIAQGIAISINNAFTYEKVRESVEKFRSLSENAPDIIYTLDENGTITYVNPAWEKILGYSEREVVGRYFNDFTRPEDARAYRKIFRRIRDGKETVRDYGGTVLDRKGHERLFMMNAAPKLDRDGNVTGLVGTLKDMTEIKSLEAQLRQVQKIEAIGTLAGGIAHDFNNILGAILGYAEMALGDLPPDSPIRHFIKQIGKASERAKELVGQILAFSRRTEQEFKPIRVSAIIREAIRFLRASLPSSIRIVQDVNARYEVVRADPTQIHQVFMNLCTNAAHAMRDTGGVLKIELSKIETGPESPVPDLSPGSHLELVVSDTGHGIDPAITDRIFDPFFTTKKPGEGTGMGLAVVHGIVRNHGGVITVESEPGQGSTFRVYLPVAAGESPSEKTQPRESPSGGRERILFVDDEEMLVELGRTMLSRLGYEVVSLTSSVEAMKVFQADPLSFDLVITDMTMPIISGLDLAQNMLRIRPELPLILITGFSETITYARIQEIGISEIIMKPVTKDALADAIRRNLDKRSSSSDRAAS
ncbi:MAG TPA: PAS domain S-box protein [Syntrophales bacterium]|nr:PAS domain S-box protein [Syntrophales bacterium]